MKDVQGLSGFVGAGRPLAGQAAQALLPQAHVVRLYANGVFTVDGGPARAIDDPANQEFLDVVTRGECPAELDPGPGVEPVTVSLLGVQEAYVPPKHVSLAVDGPGGSGAAAAARRGLPPWMLAAAYGVTNFVAVVLMGAANRKLFITHKFQFGFALNALNTICVAVGMAAMAGARVFERKAVSWRRTAPIAAVCVGGIALFNLNLSINSLGFYQMSKLLITPVLVAIEWLAYSKPASARVLASVGVLLSGITLCTVTDTQVASNPLGMLVAAGAVVAMALNQVWASTKQKELGLNGMQLVQQVSPVSAGLLAALIPVFEPVGWRSAGPGTILGYALTPAAAAWIVASGVLSLVSTVSFYLFVGATSSLTYNVVGHLHTVLFMASGAALFGDETGATTLLGLVVAMAGIVWYTHIKLEEARKPMPTDRRGSI